jgi:hypothetical protein
MWPVIEIAQVGDAGQSAQQEGQHLGLWQVDDVFLWDRHLPKLLDETDFVGELTPGDQEGMLCELSRGARRLWLEAIPHRRTRPGDG